MSFILDALRKSEHERQRQTGPGLAEVPIATHKPRTNVWATAAIALLLVNLVAVGVLLLRRAQHQEAEPVAAATPATTAASAAGSNESTPADASPANPTLQPVASDVPVTQGAAPPIAAAPPRQAAPVQPSARNPLADEVGGGGGPGLEPEIAGRAASVPQGPPAVAATPRRGSVVYAPVPEAGDAPYAEPPSVSAIEPAAAPAPARNASLSGETLPNADEMTARGGLPELHLDLHVYANAQGQSFIFVNSRKYRAGDTMQEGPVVEQITPDGAVLNYRGSRFKLTH